MEPSIDTQPTVPCVVEAAADILNEAAEPEAKTGQLSIQEIMSILPHRYPFLLIDRIEDRVDLHSAHGIKQLSMNEEFFQGHFPDNPQMPFSLVIEAMAQVGAASIMAHPSHLGRYILFAALDNATFNEPPVPGDCLDIQSVFLNYRKDIGRTRIVCKVNNEIVAEADFSFALADLDRQPAQA